MKNYLLPTTVATCLSLPLLSVSQNTIIGREKSVGSGCTLLEIDVVTGEIISEFATGLNDIDDFLTGLFYANFLDHQECGFYNALSHSYDHSMLMHAIPTGDGDFRFKWDLNDNSLPFVQEMFTIDNVTPRFSSQDLELGTFFSVMKTNYGHDAEGTIVSSSPGDLWGFEELAEIGTMEPINSDAFDSFNKDYLLLKNYEVDDVDFQTIMIFDVNDQEFTDSIPLGNSHLARLSIVYSMDLDMFWGVQQTPSPNGVDEKWVSIDTNGNLSVLSDLPSVPQKWTLAQGTFFDQTTLVASLVYYDTHSMTTQIVAIEALTGSIIATHQFPYRIESIKPNNQQYAEDNFFSLEPNQKPTEPSVSKAAKSRGSLVAYPNPANETCRVRVKEPSIIRVFDAFGREVWNSVQQVDSEVTIPVGQWSPGLYVIKGYGGAQALLVVSE